MGRISQLAPLQATIPPAPEGDVFTPQQWRTLLAICDAFVPSIKSTGAKKENALGVANLRETAAQFEPYLADGNDSSLIQTYLEENFVDIPDIQEILRSKFIQSVPQNGRDGLAFILSALNSKVGSLLLTGSTTLIHEQDLATRSLIISKWQTAYLPLLRTVYRAFAPLTIQVYLQRTSTLEKLIGFPTVPKNLEQGETYSFDFHDFTSSSASTMLSADVVIIGSGCGAGVVASTLSRAGLKVLVLEKGYHYDASYFPMSTRDGAHLLFENVGGTLSDDASTFIMAGSTFGGGGTVNWSASLQPAQTVRKEWSDTSGLPFFTSSAYQKCLDEVCKAMGVPAATDAQALADSINQSQSNKLLLEGARRLGMSTMTVPQNTGGKKHDCGYCSYGCSSTKKQGPVNNWLPDAAAHGAEFIQGCWVEKIIFSNQNGTGGKTATGVLAQWTSSDRKTQRTLTINAPRVIVSAGTLQSPLLLTRSGLNNRHIGKHLKLHPVGFIWSTYPFRVNPWEGAILTASTTGMQFADPKYPNNGPVIESVSSVPALTNTLIPFHATLNTPSNPAAASIAWKLDAAKWAHSTGWISMQRDIDSGSVYQDPNDPRTVRIRYNTSSRDREAIVKGQVAGVRMAYAAGASEIDVLHPMIPRFVRKDGAADEINAQALELWIADIRKKGLAADPENGICSTAHQMGTCRMASSADGGVLDGKGQVWGTTNVWVADASVFPSASGVNPMVSNMGIAKWIAQGIEQQHLAKKK